MNESTRGALKKLRLSGLLESLEVRIQEPAGHSLSHGEFLELILQDERACGPTVSFSEWSKRPSFAI